VVFKIGSGFEYFEPRLARLRLEFFEPRLFIIYAVCDKKIEKMNFYFY
jgi:hypothetical protein